MPGLQMWSQVVDQLDKKTLAKRLLDVHVPLDLATIFRMLPKTAKEIQATIKLRQVPLPTTTKRMNVLRKDGEMHQHTINSVMYAAPAKSGIFYSGALGRNKIMIGGHPVMAIVNAGSEIIFLPIKLCDKLGLLTSPLQNNGNHVVQSMTGDDKMLGLIEKHADNNSRTEDECTLLYKSLSSRRGDLWYVSLDHLLMPHMVRPKLEPVDGHEQQ